MGLLDDQASLNPGDATHVALGRRSDQQVVTGVPVRVAGPSRLRVDCPDPSSRRIDRNAEPSQRSTSSTVDSPLKLDTKRTSSSVPSRRGRASGGSRPCRRRSIARSRCVAPSTPDELIHGETARERIRVVARQGPHRANTSTRARPSDRHTSRALASVPGTIRSVAGRPGQLGDRSRPSQHPALGRRSPTPRPRARLAVADDPDELVGTVAVDVDDQGGVSVAGQARRPATAPRRAMRSARPPR